jgi:integrase/recombinase XerD
MTRLRKMMLEELQRRNYSQHTTRYYIRTVEDFARRFNLPPDRLGPRHIREYRAELFQKRKLSAGTVTNRLAALRFFYIKTLKKAWSVAETPYPKKIHRLPTILSQEEVARLIDAADTPFHRTLLITLYATGLRCAELTHLKVSHVDSNRMVIRVQGGKWRKDRDVMLSPKLLEELRKHWQRLRRKPSPGNRWHTADHPIDTKTVWQACDRAAKRTGLNRSSTHAPPLLRNSSARSRCRPSYHSDPVRPSRSERNLCLPTSLRTSPESHSESSGLATTKRRLTTGEVNASAAPRCGRSHPHCGNDFHRTKSPMASLEAHQSVAGHCALSYRRTRWSSRSVHPLRSLARSCDQR